MAGSTLSTRVVLVLLATSISLLAPTSAPADPLLAAAGDIACPPPQPSPADPGRCQQAATASLVAAGRPSAVTVLGDNQYAASSPDELMGPGAFDATWGAFKPLIRPAPGNHEYATTGATGYFDYFGAAAGDRTKGYYSYDLGAWHVIALNSNCSTDSTTCTAPPTGLVSTAEVAWLHADLAAHRGRCTLAYWHHPRFSTSPQTDGSPGVGQLWNELYAVHADVVLNGHAHTYERTAPLDPSGAARAGGLRQFTVGTGGKDFDLGAQKGTTPAFDNRHFGALFLRLHATGYDWSFRTIDGPPDPGSTLDRGTATCNAATRTSLRIRSKSPHAVGRRVVVDARVGFRNARSPRAFPAGRVSFSVDGHRRATAHVDAAGHARASLRMPSGLHRLVARYGGTTAVASRSTTVRIRVGSARRPA